MPDRQRDANPSARLSQLDDAAGDYAMRFVDVLLEAGRAAGASDLHLLPQAEGLAIHWRIDGVLQPIGVFPKRTAANVVARLKVLAELLTYRTDVPQEGRIRRRDSAEETPAENTGVLEMRVSTIPSLHGEKAVVRIFAAADRYTRLADLGLPEELLEQLSRLLSETSGAILVTGPAGGGKTTTVYACLRELVARKSAGRNIVSLEDPVEVAVPGVAQSQTNETAGFDLPTGLKFLLRQDPEVIMVGEIRDPPTARTAMQAALTGHLVLSTFHAGSAAEAISRLSDMGVEPYLLRSGLLAIVCQRLVRRLCDCARESNDPAAFLGLPVRTPRVPVGCDDCARSGYRGRTVLAEMLVPEAGDVGRAILSRDDASRLEDLAVRSGMVSRWRRASAAVDAGLTSAAEVRRVLGLADVSVSTSETDGG